MFIYQNSLNFLCRIECGEKHVNHTVSVWAPIPTEIMIFIMEVIQSLNSHVQITFLFRKCPFSEVGSSNDSCSENYSGPSAFSEPEIRAMGKFIDATDNIKLYFTFHSYGQLLLFPYVSYRFHFKVGNFVNSKLIIL